MKTLVVQIGNSDDKLTQSQWAAFALQINDLIEQKAYKIHFAGSSDPLKVWQNYCWVFESPPTLAASLKDTISRIARQYEQDFVAWTEGETHFI